MSKEELFVPKEKHLGKIITIIIILLILIGGAYWYYHFIYANPQNIANKSIEKLEKYINDRFNDIDTTKPLELNGLIDIKMEEQEKTDINDIINNLSIQLNMHLDEKENELDINLNSKYKNNKLINIQTYYRKNNLYLNPGEIYDNYLLIQENKLLLTKNELKDIFLKIINTIKNEANKSKWNRTNENDLIKNYIQLENENAVNHLKNILNILKNDKQFMNSIQKINVDYASKIDDYLKQINDQEKNTYSLAFYTENNLSQSLNKIEQVFNDRKITINISPDNKISIDIKDNNKTQNIKLTLSDKIININIINQTTNNKIITDLKLNYNNISNIENIDINNSKKTDELTIEEKELIQKNITNNKVINTLYNLIKEKFD